MNTPLLVPVTELLRQPGRRRPVEVVAPVAVMAPDGFTVVDARIPSEAEVGVEVELESLTNGVMVTGRVTAAWTAQCRRCLAPVTGRLRTDVCELVVPATSGDEEAFKLDGDQLDLGPLVREALTLELPLAPLCAETCAGLCAECGADLNQGQCSCDRTPPDPRWAVLDLLREDLPSES